MPFDVRAKLSMSSGCSKLRQITMRSSFGRLEKEAIVRLITRLLMDEDTKLKTLGCFDLIPCEDGVVHALIASLSAFSV